MIRVLVVDDERHVLNSLRLVLQSEGFEVVAVSSGPEALDRLKEGEFSVMVSDLCMSPLDGLDLIRCARQMRPGMQVLLLTGYASPGTAEEALRNEVFDYLIKPVHASVLAAAVRNAAEYGKAAAGGAIDPAVGKTRNASLRGYLRTKHGGGQDDR